MGRKPLIRGTEWQDIVDRCIADRWTSAAISLYLQSRYGYEVEESTVRRYRKDEKKRIEKEYADVLVESKERAFVEAHVADGHLVDHLGALGELIRLQRERIDVDAKLEQRFNKLTTGLRHEIELYGKMLAQYHEFLQDFGVVPLALGAGSGMGVAPPIAADIVSFPLMEMLDEEERENVISLTRAIHEKQKKLGAGADAGSG